MANVTVLSPQEEQELREGQSLYEMTQSAGWKIVEKWLEDRAFHTWVDPREIEGADAAVQWQWRELNAFHASNNARELVEAIRQAVSRADYLSKVKAGEMSKGKMRI